MFNSLSSGPRESSVLNFKSESDLQEEKIIKKEDSKE